MIDQLIRKKSNGDFDINNYPHFACNLTIYKRASNFYIYIYMSANYNFGYKMRIKCHAYKCFDKIFPWVWLDWQKIDDRRDHWSEI